ncbi:MAG: lysophospholipid acyltransferase family protein [Planctomycetia bacterium]|nr:lysophospholipid acyltransferase family protein [Planctomycetia bacterium]
MAWLLWRRRLEYVVFRTLVCVMQMLSASRGRDLAEGLAFLFNRVLPRKLTRYRVASDNLRQALGPSVSQAEIDETIRRMWVHLFRVVIEISQIPRKVRDDNVLSIVSYDEGRQACWQAFSSGRPVILMGGHFGNWEIANTMFGLFGLPMGVVARDLDNPYLHEWFKRFRQHTGHVMISKDGASDDTLKLLSQRGHVGLLGDQDAGPRGVFVDFFGKPASTFKSIALLALETRAVICVGGAIRLPDDWARDGHNGSVWSRFKLCCEEIIDPLAIDSHDPVGEITRRYTSAIERMVRRAPEQYFWVHKRWKSQPQQRRATQALRKAG